MIAARPANLPDGVRLDRARGTSIEAPTSQAEAAQRLKVGRPSVQREPKCSTRARRNWSRPWTGASVGFNGVNSDPALGGGAGQGRYS